MNDTRQASQVFLVGGAPGAGKTTLGRELGRSLDFASITIDDIRTAMLGVTSPATHPDLHRVGLPDAVEYFTQRTPDELITDAIDQHTALWPGVERVIRRRMRSGPGIVIDGWHLLPAQVARLDMGSITPAWLDVDSAVLESRERAVWDFYARSHDPDRMFSNFLERSVRWNDYIRNEALSHGQLVIHQDGSRSPEDLRDEILAPL
ncbi:MAG: AAA family ATPase [Actinomycetota bacterium]